MHVTELREVSNRPPRTLQPGLEAEKGRRPRAQAHSQTQIDDFPWPRVCSTDG